MAFMKNRAAFKRASKGPRSHHKVSVGARTSYTATEAKHEFGRVLEQAIHGATVVITKHDAPRAVLISMDQFKALQDAPQMKLNTLSAQFDALLDRMQSPQARRGMSVAFNASPKQLGKAAVVSARKRG
jgi:antitoxin Phd